MPKSGPIVFIDDDPDDQELYCEILKELQLPNKIQSIFNGKDALNYLRHTKDQPFIIFCDINMPQLNGIELRNEINNDEYLKGKSIPFIFLTTAASKDAVREAYYMSVQGFFKKLQSYEEIKDLLQEIIIYWKKCQHPNSISLF